MRNDPAGRRRWEEAGKPRIPAALIEGVAISILYPGQLAPILNLPEPGGLDVTRLAWDLVAIGDAWIKAVRGLDLGMLSRVMPLSTPDPARHLTVRDLVVNVFHPIALLPGAWDTGHLPWFPEERDEEISATLHDAAAVLGYARSGSVAWTSFVLDRQDGELADRDPRVSSPRGTVSFTQLVASQRWHAAFHYRQLADVLTSWGAWVSGGFDLATIPDLVLPREIM
jgi:hypothetical protein